MRIESFANRILVLPAWVETPATEKRFAVAILKTPKCVYVNFCSIRHYCYSNTITLSCQPISCPKLV